MSFPVDGQIENTRWETIARSCLPASDCPDVNRLGQDFLNYLHFHHISLDHSTVFERFRYFCRNLAPRNYD